jgi:hypothetical protein
MFNMETMQCFSLTAKKPEDTKLDLKGVMLHGFCKFPVDYITIPADTKVGVTKARKTNKEFVQGIVDSMINRGNDTIRCDPIIIAVTPKLIKGQAANIEWAKTTFEALTAKYANTAPR